MLANGVRPNSFIFTSMTDGFFKNGKVDAGIKCFGRVIEEGIELDVAAYGAIVWGLCTNGRLEKALELSSDMKRRRLRPDKITLQLSLMHI
jgi:pentatricopeptide repeat domain-containing protein 1